MDAATESSPASAQQQQPKPVKACDACHAIKIKCVQDSPSGETPCGRCSRLNLPCTFTPRVRKKQQKRTDARVAVLEREVEILRSALAAQAGLGVPSPASSANTHSSSDRNPFQALVNSGDGAKPMATDGLSTSHSADDVWPTAATTTNASTPPAATVGGSATVNVVTPPRIQAGDLDSVSRGIGSAENVEHLIDMFRENFSHLHWVVQIPPSLTPFDLAEKRPLLLQAIIGVTSQRANPRLAYRLQTELTKSYLASLGSDEARSLDLVEAILVTVTWYVPPADYKRKMKFYQLGHIAMSTAIDLSIGSEEDEEQPSSGTDEKLPPSGDALERARTFLGCYQFSQGVAMTMRRPSMLRSSDGVEYSFKILQPHAYDFSHDRALLLQTKLFRIAEEIGSSVVRTEIMKGHKVADEHVRNHIQIFREKLDQWHDEAGMASLNGILSAMYHYILCYLHEIALYSEHNPKDFASPFKYNRVGLTNLPPIPTSSAEARRSASYPTSAADATNASKPQRPSLPLPVPSQIVTSSLIQMIRSAHSYLDVFIAFDVETLRCIPISNYFRLMYVIFVLTKLFMSTHDKRSAIGAQLNRGLLRAETYRILLTEKLAQAAENGRFPAPQMFVNHLENLDKNWIELQRRLSAEALGTGPSGQGWTMGGHGGTWDGATSTGGVLGENSPEQSGSDKRLLDPATLLANMAASMPTRADPIANSNASTNTLPTDSTQFSMPAQTNTSSSASTSPNYSSPSNQAYATTTNPATSSMAVDSIYDSVEGLGADGFSNVWPSATEALIGPGIFPEMESFDFDAWSQKLGGYDLPDMAAAVVGQGLDQGLGQGAGGEDGTAGASRRREQGQGTTQTQQTQQTQQAQQPTQQSSQQSTQARGGSIGGVGGTYGFTGWGQ